MAAGGRGAVTVLLVYCLLTKILKPIHVEPVRICDNIFPLLHLNDNSSKYEDLGHKQTNNDLAKASTDYGTYTLAMTLVYPLLYHRKTKSTTPTQSSLTTGLIITICLMLSGDIHPCPGPHHFKTSGEANLRAEDKHATHTLQLAVAGLSFQGGEGDAVDGAVPGRSVGALREVALGPRVRVGVSEVSSSDSVQCCSLTEAVIRLVVAAVVGVATVAIVIYDIRSRRGEDKRRTSQSVLE